MVSHRCAPRQGRRRTGGTRPGCGRPRLARRPARGARSADDAGLAPLQAPSEMNTAPRCLGTLPPLGRLAAERRLAARRKDVGVRSTLDIAATLLAAREVVPL